MSDLILWLERFARALAELQVLGPRVFFLLALAVLFAPIVDAALWVVAALGAALGVIVLAQTVGSATGAPQEAAGAAMAVACAVLPYVLARAWSEVTREPARWLRRVLWRGIRSVTSKQTTALKRTHRSRPEPSNSAPTVE